MKDNQKLFWPLIYIFLISLVINGYITSQNLQYLHYSGGTVGPILKLFKQMQMFLYSFGISAILVLILFFFKKLRSYAVAIIIGLIISAYFTDIITYSLANPKQPTEEELLEENKKKANNFLNKFDFFLPHDSVIQKDTSSLVEELKAMFTGVDTKGPQNSKQEIQLKLSNHILGMNFDHDKVPYLHQYGKSLSCDYITYSKEHEQFLAMLTYKSLNENPTNKYNGILVMCEKQDKQTLCFTFYNRNGKLKESKEAAFHSLLSVFFERVKVERVKELWNVLRVSECMSINIKEYEKHPPAEPYSNNKNRITIFGRAIKYLY